MTALVAVEEHLQALAPRIERMGTIAPSRLLETLMMACERNRALASCQLPSLLSAAMSAAVLGLEPDGVMGQAALVPFKGRAQYLAMVHGYCTLADRAARSLTGHLVWEGDEFTFDEARGEWHHPQRLRRDTDPDRVVGAYAVSRAEGRPTLLKVMSIEEVKAIRDRSPAWRRDGQRSTWGQFPLEMIRKTPMRALAKSLPVINLRAAAALDTQHQELGRHAHLEEGPTVHTDDGTIEIEGEVEHIENTGPEMMDPGPEPEWLLTMPNGRAEDARTKEKWVDALARLLGKNEGRRSVERLWELNEARVWALPDDDPDKGRLVDVYQASRP